MAYTATDVSVVLGFYCHGLLQQSAEIEESPPFRTAAMWGFAEEVSNSKLLQWANGQGMTPFPNLDPVDGTVANSKVLHWLGENLGPVGLETDADFRMTSCCYKQGEWRKCHSVELYGQQGAIWNANKKIDPINKSIVDEYEQSTGTTLSTAVRQDFDNLVVVATVNWNVSDV